MLSLGLIVGHMLASALGPPTDTIQELRLVSATSVILYPGYVLVSVVRAVIAFPLDLEDRTYADDDGYNPTTVNQLLYKNSLPSLEEKQL